MNPNPVLAKLGLAQTDRAVLIHADDIGMCQASLAAMPGLMDLGLVSCASVMVTCPWFSAAARFAIDNPGVDLGVHLTLTCEWQTYRWAPISTVSMDSGLIDGVVLCIVPSPRFRTGQTRRPSG